MTKIYEKKDYSLIIKKPIAIESYELKDLLKQKTYIESLIAKCNELGIDKKPEETEIPEIPEIPKK